jgi:hypothetical protein
MDMDYISVDELPSLIESDFVMMASSNDITLNLIGLAIPGDMYAPRSPQRGTVGPELTRRSTPGDMYAPRSAQRVTIDPELTRLIEEEMEALRAGG